MMTPEFKIFLLSILPVTELRISIPVGFHIGLSIYEAFIISVLGNIFFIPLLLWFYNTLYLALREIRILRQPFIWLEEKTKNRARIVEKYEIIGLIIFVAIPLPATGIWAGSFVATLFKLRFKQAFFAVATGAIIAAIIVSILTVSTKFMYNAILFSRWI